LEGNLTAMMKTGYSLRCNLKSYSFPSLLFFLTSAGFFIMA
jgi:hypothetical protein